MLSNTVWFFVMFCVIVSFLADVYEGHPSTLWSLLTDKTQGGTGEGPSIYTTLLLLLMYVWVQASAKVSIPYGQSEKISFLAKLFFCFVLGVFNVIITSKSFRSRDAANVQQPKWFGQKWQKKVVNHFFGLFKALCCCRRTESVIGLI